VVTTIMLNALIQLAISGLVNDVFRAPGFSFARTASVGNATLTGLGNTTLHVGVVFAVLCIPLSYWLLWRTTVGFEIRAVGANPTAALYAGMKPRRMIILTMSLCGAFAGLAGAIEILRLGYYRQFSGQVLALTALRSPFSAKRIPLALCFPHFSLGPCELVLRSCRSRRGCRWRSSM
jgi:simple sugar transport system permease protein